jgi:hypothetical protein
VLIATCAATLALALLPQFAWPTLDEELKTHGLEAAGFQDADHRITSYKVLNERWWFAIAYYRDDGSGLLPEILRVRTYDKRTGRWEYAEFNGNFGSILRLHRGGAWWYVSGHLSPSAAPTLVLSRNLRLVRTLNGWPQLALPDGRLIYQHSMVHFSPAHPGSLGVYDPATNADVPLFPAARVALNSRAFFVNRSFSDLRLARSPHTIAFSVAEQNVRLTPANTGEPVGAVRTLKVTCNLSAKPRCVVRRSNRERRSAASVSEPALTARTK